MAGGHVAHCLGGILSGRRASSTVAVSSEGALLNGEELVDGVRRLAAGLSDRGVRSGDVVAVVGFNSIEYVELLLAIPYAGAIVAPLNYRWSFEEAAQALELVRPSVFIFDGGYGSWARRLMDSGSFSYIGLYLTMGDPVSTSHAANFGHIKRSPRGTVVMEPLSAPRDVALICFTSGTTGRPKGVAISHTSLIIQSLAKIAVVGYGLSAYSSSVPYRRDLLMLGHPDGRRLPCPDTEIRREISFQSHSRTQSDLFHHRSGNHG